MKVQFKGSVVLKVNDVELRLNNYAVDIEGSLKDIKQFIQAGTEEVLNLVHKANPGETVIVDSVDREAEIERIMKEKGVDKDIAETIYNKHLRSEAITHIMQEKQVDFDVAEAIYEKELEENRKTPGKAVTNMLSGVRKTIGNKLAPQA